MQRLSGLDASFLYFETRSQLLHVCGLIVLDVSGMEDGYSFEALRTELRRRITAMPPFRRKLHDSLLNVDHPVWVEAEDFDIDHHLHRVGIPEPGGDHELAELCAHLSSQPIDRSMPLWQMYVIEGLPDGRVAVFAKMHHSTVDGVTGANMLSQLCTLSPDEPELDEELVEETAGGSGALELAVGGALSRLATPWRLASLLPGTVGVLPSWINRARKGLAMPAPFTAPRTPFNRTITGHRSISYASVDLADIKRVKNAFGTTVNDVVLAVCSTALRKYLDDRDALPRKPLIAMVPMSVHAAESRPGTNRVSGMFMSLATDIDDPVGRLEAIRDANTVAKDHTDALDANLLTDWAQFAAPSVFGSAVRMYSRLRLSERHPVVHNLVISNVPGPNFPLYFLGAKIEKMLPLGPVFHGAGLNCTVMSLDGSLHFGFIGCRDLVPDPWPLANAVEDALAEFVVAAEEREKSGTPTAARKSAGELAQERKEQRSAARQASKESAKSGSKATAVIGRDRSSTREATQDESGAGAASRPAAGEAGATTAPAKKAPAKKAPAKKAAAKKAPAKKAAAKQAPAEKVSAEKAPAKKAPAKKAPAKKAPATKAPAKKTSARKAPATTSSQQKRAAKPTGSKPAASTPAATTPAATTQTAPTQTAAGPDRRTTAPEAPAGPGTPADAAQAPTYSAPAATVLGDDEISATPTPPIETLPAPDPTGDETSSDTQTGQV
ncbi:WS/DGAT/MGAT family acyltransferase [Dietzia kunjamensis]|nr:wax ester/triacylglycerol synthase family O-acyltransferase [Dietzia kunjamensis]RKE58267.1 WS/DGAT/MGAT family acyltransferase [Dietzia kunjamensis]